MLPMDLTAATNVSSRAQLGEDEELGQVAEELMRLDPDGKRFAATLRDTIDQLLNGENTGRYDWATLFKTEKTHAGTIVEINLQREFKFHDGVLMDYRIAGIEVDCKYSQRFGSWMIPPEALGHICLLVWADDYQSRWSAGLLRIKKEWLNVGSNRDAKMTVRAEHRNKIYWLWQDAELPENVLLHIEPSDRAAVFAPASGQARLNELFRRAQNRRIGRNVVRTVAQQKDYMKRVRGNGGSRSALQPEGIVIIGDYDSHKEIAAQLELPVPEEGEFVSTRLVKLPHEDDERPSVTLDGAVWACARPGEPAECAPALPSHTKQRRAGAEQLLP